MAKKKAKKASPEASGKGELPRGKFAMSRDPRVYAAKIPVLLPQHKRFVGLDLASSTGVTFCDIVPEQPVSGATLVMGQWDLGHGSGDYDSGPLRLVRLRQFLAILQPDLVVLEDARFGLAADGAKHGPLSAIVARAVSGAEFLGALKATAACWCEEHRVPCHGVSSTVLKRFATGKGNCDKTDMIRAANAQFGTNFNPEDYARTGVDNICDSAFLCALGVHLYSEALPTFSPVVPPALSPDLLDNEEICHGR